MARSLALLSLMLTAYAGWQQPAAAQNTPAPAAQGAVLKLQLVDDETGDPITGAIVKIKGLPDTTTGAAGRVELTGLKAKSWQVEFRALGYEPRMETIYLTEGQVLSMRFGLSFTGDKLPDVVVTERRSKLSPRYADFHRRMTSNLGFYVTWETIKQKGYANLGETLRGVRGVYVNCAITDCKISMSRSRGCVPTFWLDGIEGGSFASAVPIRDVYGIEVYRGAGETPGEYAGSGGCGVIVIWTKSKPYR